MPPGRTPGWQSPSPIRQDEGVLGKADRLAEFVPTQILSQVIRPPQTVAHLVNDDFRTTISESHDMVVRVDVSRPGFASSARRLYPHEGSITYVADDSTSSSMKMTVTDIDGTLTPAEAQDDLSPFLAEIRPYRGVIYSNTVYSGSGGYGSGFYGAGIYGSSGGAAVGDLVPLGVFRVTEVHHKGLKEYDISGYDVSDRLKQPLTEPFVITAGLKFEDAIARLLLSRLPTLNFRLKATGFVTPTLIIEAGKNPWQEAGKLALSCGDWLYIGRDGAVVTEAVRAVDSAAPMWDFIEGSRSVFWDASRITKSDQFPNVVKITGGSSASGAITATVEDNDPQSPTFVNRIGRIVYAPPADERITTTDQARAAALAVLQRKAGPADEVTVSAVPNPALQLGHTVHVKRDDIGLDRHMVVSHIELPLTADKEMSVTLRRSIITSQDAPLGDAMLVAR